MVLRLLRLVKILGEAMNDEETTFGSVEPPFEEFGNSSELIEIEDYVIEEIADDGSTISLGGEAKRTVWSADQRRVVKHRRKKLVGTDDGFFVPVEHIVGVCSECREQGIRRVLSKTSARRCETCGRLLGSCHQRVVDDKVYCSRHWFWAWVEHYKGGEVQKQIPERNDDIRHQKSN